MEPCRHIIVHIGKVSKDPLFCFLFLFLFVFVFFIINEDCSFCVLFYVQLHLFIVYIKEKMLSVEKIVSDPIVILGQ